MDIENTRFNMIEQQIRPWGVLDPAILDLLFQVKREYFIAPTQRSLAFADTELPLPNRSTMLQPKIEARMVQEAQIKPTDIVLEIGTGSGYLTALLAKRSQTVYSLDIDAIQQQLAATHLKQAGINNVVLVTENGIKGLPEYGLFNVIIVGGSLPVVPEALKQQLVINGNMLITVGEWPVMTCKRIQRIAQNHWEETGLFETCITPLSYINTIQPTPFEF